ncbi:DUF4168 domain-containing protein [Mesonia sediminis]|uniref:DUF4168 domain-containing protein n=1 Tax=Mesonia sediminis TaxID=1703946 RepID=A0ABW5SEJ8_9FLAO|nr:DUF4168 domain-containing protein [Mesonia sp. HuA40]
MRRFKNVFFAMVMLLSANAFAQEAQVSDADLAKFAEAYKAVQVENRELQQEMVAYMKKEGMEVQRFQAIQQASVNPNQEVEATPAEMKSYKKVVAKVQEMQPQLQKDMMSIIQDKGLSIERYQQIGAALQQNPELQQKLQNLMMKQE